jgi:hypothetical protein
MALLKTGTVTLAVLLFAVVVTVMCQTATSQTSQSPVTGSTAATNTTLPTAAANTSTAATTLKPSGQGGNASTVSSSVGLAVLTLVLSLVSLH